MADEDYETIPNGADMWVGGYACDRDDCETASMTNDCTVDFHTGTSYATDCDPGSSGGWMIDKNPQGSSWHAGVHSGSTDWYQNGNYLSTTGLEIENRDLICWLREKTDGSCSYSATPEYNPSNSPGCPCTLNKLMPRNVPVPGI